MNSSAAAGTLSPVIRPALEADLPRVLALLERSVLPTVGVVEIWPDFLVAESGGDIVGVVGVEACGDGYALLRSTAVADEWRRRGLGRTLVERAIADARGRGVDALYLLTTTAEAYFPSFGFSRVSREEVPVAVQGTEEFSSACPASAAVMMLSLREAS